MKKIITLIIILFAICSLFFTSCTIYEARPESGLYYCKELNVTIEFNQSNIGIVHDENGNCKEYEVFLDFGNSIDAYDQISGEFVFVAGINGTFKYKNDIFYVTDVDSKKKYEFYKVSEYLCNYCDDKNS